MKGLAGKAKYVSDFVCLLVIHAQTADPISIKFGIDVADFGHI